MYEMIRRFAQAVDCGGITAAAEKLAISQPAVSKSLQQLEEHYGVELLIRGRKGAVPTEYGKVVYRLAKLMEKSFNDVATEIDANKSRRARKLRIGAGILWSYVYLPDALNSVIKRHPDFRIELVLRSPGELHNMVSDGRLDLAVGAMPKERHAGIIYEELLPSKDSIFAHHAHPLRSKAEISDEDLERCHWIVLGGRKKNPTTHNPAHYNQTNLTDPLMACLLLQKGFHLIHLPLALTPMVEKFGIVPLRQHVSEVDVVTGIFYGESALLKSSSIEIIKRLRRVGLSET